MYVSCRIKIENCSITPSLLHQTVRRALVRLDLYLKARTCRPEAKVRYFYEEKAEGEGEGEGESESGEERGRETDGARASG